VLLLAALAAGQAQEQYLDVYIAQVKPEKPAEFDAISRKIAAANRQNKGMDCHGNRLRTRRPGQLHQHAQRLWGRGKKKPRERLTRRCKNLLAKLEPTSCSKV
jgi:hypothetical protein